MAVSNRGVLRRSHVANNPLRWIDPDGLSTELLPDPANMPETEQEVRDAAPLAIDIGAVLTGIGAAADEAVVQGARQGAKACSDYVAKNKNVIKAACKNSALAAILGLGICEGRPAGSYPRHQETLDKIREATQAVPRRNTGGIPDK